MMSNFVAFLLAGLILVVNGVSGTPAPDAQNALCIVQPELCGGEEILANLDKYLSWLCFFKRNGWWGCRG